MRQIWQLAMSQRVSSLCSLASIYMPYNRKRVKRIGLCNLQYTRGYLSFAPSAGQRDPYSGCCFKSIASHFLQGLRRTH